MSSDELAQCANLADGVDCAVDGVSGKCVSGACTPVICGNGIVDPGEVCDDGNQVSGDGCNATCTSNETCGNGIVDTARGESCDCGDAAHLSPLCTVPNSDDPAAPCSLTCQSRFCGDGVVDLNEQCDGSVGSNVSCADFGYYGGTLSCSGLCQLDPTTCAGRCGDGAIDTSHGEYCDQVLPAGASCFDFGYDVGALACGLGCGPDLGNCDHLGWERVGSFQNIVDLWGGAGRVGVVYGNTGTAVVIHDGLTDPAPASYSVIAGSVTQMWAAGSDHVASWTAAAGWVDTAAPWPAGTTISDVWASDTLGVFVSTAAEVPLWHYDGTTWTTVTGAWAAGAGFGQPGDKLYVMASDDVYIWDGATWTTLGQAGVTAVAAEDNGTLWILQGQQAYRQSDSGWDAFSVDDGIATGLAPARGGMFISQLVQERHTYSTDLALVGPQYYSDGGPPGFFGPSVSSLMVSNGSGALYAKTGANKLYALSSGESSVLGDGRTMMASFAAGGPLVTWSSSGYNYTGEDGTGYNGPLPDTCNDVGVAPSGTIYCAGVTAVWQGATDVVDGYEVARAMWIAPDESAIAVVGDDSFVWLQDGTWNNIVEPTMFTELAGDAFDDLYAIGTGDADTASRLFHFNGSTWSAVSDQLGLSHVVVADHTVYALDADGVFTYARANGATATLPTPIAFDYLAGGNGWLFGASSDPNQLPSQLWTYANTTWSPIRTNVTTPMKSLREIGTHLVFTTDDEDGYSDYTVAEIEWTGGP